MKDKLPKLTQQLAHPFQKDPDSDDFSFLLDEILTKMKEKKWHMRDDMVNDIGTDIQI